VAAVTQVAEVVVMAETCPFCGISAERLNVYDETVGAYAHETCSLAATNEQIKQARRRLWGNNDHDGAASAMSPPRRMSAAATVRCSWYDLTLPSGEPHCAKQAATSLAATCSLTDP
jgi:hypothetical protein